MSQVTETEIGTELTKEEKTKMAYLVNQISKVYFETEPKKVNLYTMLLVHNALESALENLKLAAV